MLAHDDNTKVILEIRWRVRMYVYMYENMIWLKNMQDSRRGVEWSGVETRGKEGRRQKGQMVNDKNASTSEDSGQEDILSPYSSSDLDTGTPPPTRLPHPSTMENRTLDASARSSGHLFEFDPGQSKFQFHYHTFLFCSVNFNSITCLRNSGYLPWRLCLFSLESWKVNDRGSIVRA